MSNTSEPDCKAIENQLKGLEAAQARLQNNLQHAAGGDKQSLLQEIRDLESEIREKQREFNAKRCRAVTMKWTVAGASREALVFPPVAAGEHPLIFAWHGHGGTMQGAAEEMHFHSSWHDAIVVYPQGLLTETGHDEEGNVAGWQKDLDPSPNRDLLLFDAMLATLREKYSVDGRRIYTAGFSNGTGFSYLLWVERGHTLAAIGAVAGVLIESEIEKRIPPRALISIAGSEGIAPDAVQKTIERAREVNSATEPGQPCAIPNGAPATTTCILYQSASHTPVKQITHPLGHVYPVWAPDEVVEFFKRHQRP